MLSLHSSSASEYSLSRSDSSDDVVDSDGNEATSSLSEEEYDAWSETMKADVARDGTEAEGESLDMMREFEDKKTNKIRCCLSSQRTNAL